MEIIRKMTWTKIKFLIWAIVPPFLLGIFLGILYFCLSCSEIRKTPLMILLTYILIIITYELLIFAYIPLSQDIQYYGVFRQGNLLYNQKDYEGAKYCFETALGHKPDSAEVYYGLGNTFNKLMKYGDAKESYKKAINKKSDYWEAHKDLAYLLLNHFESKEAEKEFKETISILEKKLKKEKDLESIYKYHLAETHKGLGVVLDKLGGERYKDAEEAFIEAIRLRKELKEDYWEAHYALAHTLYKDKNLEEAVKEFREVKESKPDFYEIHYCLGNVLSELKRNEEAGKSYREAIKLNPYFKQAYVNLYVVLKKLRKENERNDLKKEFWKHFRKVLK